MGQKRTRTSKSEDSAPRYPTHFPRNALNLRASNKINPTGVKSSYTSPVAVHAEGLAPILTRTAMRLSENDAGGA